jgi:peptidoglycan/xylan/chitin deacetylase (PgdA/CDA1 family)
MDEIIERLDHYGYVYADWNVTSNEKDPALLAEDLIEQSHWRNRVIILLHDRSNCSEVLKALPLLIDKLKEEGYVFELIEPSRQVVQF